MIVKVVIVVCLAIITIASAYMNKWERAKWIVFVMAIVLLAFQVVDLVKSQRKENERDAFELALSSDSKQSKKALSETLLKVNSIDKALAKFNLKISGDTVKPITTFVNNSTTNVKSESQKGGQTGGIIYNNK